MVQLPNFHYYSKNLGKLANVPEHYEMYFAECVANPLPHVWLIVFDDSMYDESMKTYSATISAQDPHDPEEEIYEYLLVDAGGAANEYVTINGAQDAIVAWLQSSLKGDMLTHEELLDVLYHDNNTVRCNNREPCLYDKSFERKLK